MTTEERLPEWLEAVASYAREYRKLPALELTAEIGPRYIRIVETDGPHHRSAFCFVDRQSGAILKAAGWKGPAKGVRGSIFAEDFGIGKAVTPYGAAYAR